MQAENLHTASYRGAVWFVSTADTSGGRKDAIKEIANSDRRVIEDLGKRQRSFSVAGTIAARYSNSGQLLYSYEDMRDVLLQALELGGTGVLVHPFYGRLNNIACRTYELNESMSKLGEASISIQFEISNSTGVPQVEEAVLNTVTTQSAVSWDLLGRAMGNLYATTPAYTLNPGDGIAKVNAYVVSLQAATQPLTNVASEINEFSAELSALATNAAALVEDPWELADAITGTFETTKALLATPRAIYESMARLFNYGDLDAYFPLTTAARIERQKNRDLMNTMVQGGSLTEAYVAAAELDLPTADDIDATLAVLEAQYQKMKTAAAWESEVETEVTRLRIALSAYFDAQRATKPRLIDIYTHETPARVLAYSYYGSSENGAALATLNGVTDAAFVKGTVQILTS